MNVYIVVGDIAAHSGFISEQDTEFCWSGSCQWGWTYQQVTGSHGTVLGEFATRAEAEACLGEFLRCDSAEQGTYCYSHNPHGR